MTEDLERIRKAFSLALDKKTPEQEQKAAWLGALRLCLSLGIGTFDGLLEHFGTTPKSFFQTPEAQNPYGWDTMMPFGKHRGDALGVIARNEPAYLMWLQGQDLSSSHLRRSVNSVCDWLKENPEE